MIAKAYLEDLSDEELLLRPVEGANHIAWQLGHLISSEHNMVEMVCPGSMPPLPDGFADAYTKETAASDEGAAFLTKVEYLKLMDYATMRRVRRIASTETRRSRSVER